MQGRYKRSQFEAKSSRKGLPKIEHSLCAKRGQSLGDCGINVAITTSGTQEGKICALLAPGYSVQGGRGRTNSWFNSAAVPLLALFGPGCRHFFDLPAEWRPQPWPPSHWHYTVAWEGLQSSACHQLCAVLLTDWQCEGSWVYSQWKAASSR